MDRIVSTEQEGSRVDDGTRRSFLRRAAGVVAAGAAGVAGMAGLAPSIAQADGNPLAFIIRAFRDIKKHENDHRDQLLKVLGSNARPKPTFQGLTMPSVNKFLAVSRALENTGVGAYLGAAPSIKSSTYLAAAGSIGFIEARHAGYLNTLTNLHITANILELNNDHSFERPLSPQEVVTQAKGFIVSLNGGPPLDYVQGSQDDANDIAILNFALALEYLEADFYNINVGRLFGGVPVPP